MTKIQISIIFFLYFRLVSVQSYSLTTNGNKSCTEADSLWICTDKSRNSLTYKCKIYSQDYFADSKSKTHSSFVQNNEEAENLTISDCGRIDFNTLPAKSAWPNLKQVNFVNVDFIDFSRDNLPQYLKLKKVKDIRLSYPISCQKLELNQVQIKGFNLKQYSGENSIFDVDRHMSELKIIDSEIPHISYGGFTVNADQVVIQGNLFDTIEPGGLKIKCRKIQITKNIFKSLKSHSFNGIGISDKNYTDDNFTQILIENNIIDNLEIESLNVDHKSTFYHFDVISFKKNKPDCSCNCQYFKSIHSLAEDTKIGIKQRLYYHQILDHNICIHNDNCNIRNFLKMCDTFDHTHDVCIFYDCETDHTLYKSDSNAAIDSGDDKSDKNGDDKKDDYRNDIDNDDSHDNDQNDKDDYDDDDHSDDNHDNGNHANSNEKTLVTKDNINFEKYFYITLLILILFILFFGSFIGFYIFKNNTIVEIY